MAKGRPSKWASVGIEQVFWLDKTGIKIVVWDKYRRQRKGTLFISIGGLRWRAYMGKKPARYISWDSLENAS